MAQKNVSNLAFQAPGTPDPWLDAYKQLLQGGLSSTMPKPAGANAMGALGQTSYATAGGQPVADPGTPLPGTTGTDTPGPGLPPKKPAAPAVPPPVVSDPPGAGTGNPGTPPPKTTPTGGTPPTPTPPIDPNLASSYQQWLQNVQNWGGWDEVILQELLASGDYDALMKKFLADTQGHRFLSPWQIQRYTNKYSALPFLDMYIQNGIDAKPDDGGQMAPIRDSLKNWVLGDPTGMSNFGNRRNMANQLFDTLGQAESLAMQGKDNKNAADQRERDLLNQWAFFNGSDSGANLLQAFMGSAIGASPYGQFERERFVDASDIGTKTMMDSEYGPGGWIGWLLRNWVGGTHRFNNPWEMNNGQMARG